MPRFREDFRHRNRRERNASSGHPVLENRASMRLAGRLALASHESSNIKSNLPLSFVRCHGHADGAQFAPSWYVEAAGLRVDEP